jgi:hypothetical protein
MAVRVNSLPPLPDMLQTLGAISGQLFSQSIRQTCYRLYRVRRCHYPHVNDARGSQTQLVDEPYRGLVYQLTTQTGVVHRWGHTPFSLARNCSRIERGLHGSATFFPCRRFDTPLDAAWSTVKTAITSNGSQVYLDNAIWSALSDDSRVKLDALRDDLNISNNRNDFYSAIDMAQASLA